jgi:hypothetical protein
MVKHVILWKVKDGVSLQDKLNAKSALENLNGKIEGLVDIKVQILPLSSSNADMMLDSTFESEDALKLYASHPLHVAAADGFVRPITKERTCMDYEV